ncbi:MAG: hypothetical protein Q7S82_02320 [bacterium]|nr:hypothetical protein [bacterium]
MEIIPKKPSQYSVWFNILLYISLILFVFVLVVFLIFNNSVKNSQKVLKNTEDNLAKEDTPEKAALKKEIAAAQKKINDFSGLIDQHLANTEPFKFIERKTHPRVWFSQINISSREGTVSLSGETKSFESLGQQLMIFREETLVRSVALKNVAIGKEGRIVFDLSISLAPEIFKPSFVLPE